MPRLSFRNPGYRPSAAVRPAAQDQRPAPWQGEAKVTGSVEPRTCWCLKWVAQKVEV